MVDTYWDDPTDTETKTNYGDEVASFSNVADILVVNPSDDIIARMQQMQIFQMKSILHLTELFFEIEGTNSPSGTDYKLRTDFKSRWDTFATTNALIENEHLIQVFYIGEEPTWNGITATELQMATNYVKSEFSQVPVMVIEAYATLENLQIPETVDWVGFDHYFIKDQKNDVTFNNEIQLLKSKLSEDQKLVFIMDTHYIEAAHKNFGGITLNQMGNVAKSYYELAKSEPKTIAILCYFWPSGFDNSEAIGARHMPKTVKEEYIRIGKQITKK